MTLFRKWGSISSDPDFPYRVGRLIGASEMVGHIFQKSTDPEKQRYGALIIDRVEWFLETPGSKPVLNDKVVEQSEMSTRVIPPVGT